MKCVRNLVIAGGGFGYQEEEDNVPINTEVKDFAETMTSVIQSTAAEKGTSNFWRNQSIDDLAVSIQEKAQLIISRTGIERARVTDKDYALKIAIAAMHIWQKL